MTKPSFTFLSMAALSSALALATSARAQETCSGCRDENRERMHFALGYERLVLPVADTTFHGGDTLPSHTGRELGFLSPAVSALDFRWSFSGRRGFGLVIENIIGGWGARDAVGTDPFASEVRGDMIIMDWGFGIEGRVPLGGGVQLRTDVTAGPQIAMVKVSDAPRNNSLAAIQLFLRPRVALEVPLVDHFHLGAFLTDDVLRVRSWGFGAYAGFSL
jgi:hypothetical protein